MYCVKCGVELAGSEKSCPLCGTPVYCPTEERKLSDAPYPPYPGAVGEGISRGGIMFILTMLSFIVFALCLTIDYRINGEILWSGFASGAILLFYIFVLLPCWFRAPNPVIFVPCDFAAASLYLLYVNYAVDGHWFFSLALPVTGGFALIVCTVVTLFHCVRKGRLFILGGACMAFGGLSVLIEVLIRYTFRQGRLFGWSVYPLSVGVLLGGLLLLTGICRPLREIFRKKLFF